MKAGAKTRFVADAAPEKRDALALVVAAVAARHRAELDKRKLNAKDIERPDFIWHYLLQSFSTMGGSGGWEGLIGTPANYARVVFDVIAALPGKKRLAHIERVLRAAKVRWPGQKAGYLVAAHRRITHAGGLAAARQLLLDAPGRAGKTAFLLGFDGIGPKYARNIMMDVFHPDFHDAVAVDSRIERILKISGVVLSTYDAKEAFLVDVARRASLLPWELDRCCYWFRDEVIAGLRGASHPVVSVSMLADDVLSLLDATPTRLSDSQRKAVRVAIHNVVERHRGSTLAD